MDNATAFGQATGPGFFEVAQVAGALLLLLGVIYVAYWLLKRFGPKAGIGGFSRGRMSMKVQGQVSLGPKKSVVVVRFLNKVMVLGVTDHSINLLTELDEDHDRSENGDFKTALEKADMDRDSS